MSKQTFRRLDVFNSDLGSVEKTDEGFAHFFARATRTGVFLYRNNDGSIRRELRMPEEVFKDESMKTLQNKPITNDHPTQLVDSKNARDYTVGMTGHEVVKDGRFIKTKAVITDENTINDVIQKGKAQVSCGYTCEHEVKSGTFDGEKFDVIQRNIKYNHLAVVDTGRAGPEVKLRLDAGDAIMVQDTDGKLIFDVSNISGSEENKKETILMSKIIIDGVEQEVSEEFKKAFDAKGEAFKKILEKNKKKEEDEEESKKKKDSEVSALQAKVDSLEAEANKESEESKKAKMDAEVNAKVKARLILNDAAKARCSAEVVSKLDSMSDSEVKKAVISTTLKEDSAIKLDEKDETYIDTRFDIVMESEVKVKSDAGSVVGEHIVNARTTKEDVSGVDNTRMENWKKPLSMQKTNSVK